MIGYYIHHHGHGHMARAVSISAHLQRPVTALTSRPLPEAHPFTATVTLPRDDTAEHVAEPTAHGALHWAPHHDAGYGARMQALAEWVADTGPDACVVDVSVEVAVFLRLLGVPVIVVAQPGDRTDPAHTLVYQVADHILAPWPRELNTPRWLLPHAAKTSYVGGISRFEGRTVDGYDADRDARIRAGELNVLLLGGAGGGFDKRIPSAGPDGVRWKALGGAGGDWVDDPWAAICDADVVVSHAGQNSVADLAAARRRAIVIPQPRPFDEQEATANVLARHGLAATATGWPDDDAWPLLLQTARESDPGRWRRWRVDGAAARAAEAIEDTAHRCRRPVA
ncbi:glycosyltransferase [Mycolicibacterium gilvum]|nr:glycosyltransferase [Mycolicibacterium gilvum]